MPEEKKRECIFCKIARGDITTSKIYENSSFFSIPDANPVVDGHSLIISKRHFSTTLDLPEDLGIELVDCIKKTALELMKDKDVNGFNVINNNFKTAGQIVEHVHFHIIPRKNDDCIDILN